MSSVSTRQRSSWSGDGARAKLLLAYARLAPSHPTKIRVFRALSRIFFPRGLRVRDELGVQLLVDPLDYIGHAICFAGAFEPLSLDLAKRLMQGGGTFVDVGSNIGLYTCSLSRLEGVRCIAIDASARAFTKLQDNLTLNSGSDVTAVNVALGSHRSFASLDAPEFGNLGTTRVSSRGLSFNSSKCVVAVVPLRELLAAAEVTSIRLLKIDVEGFELEVFRGMDLSEGACPDSILMEYSRGVSDASSLQSSFDLLSSAGYEARTVTGSRFQGTEALPEENLWWSRASPSRSAELVG